MKRFIVIASLVFLCSCENLNRMPDENPTNLTSEENLADAKFKSYNEMGWIVNDLDEISVEFLNEIDGDSKVLEIGAGFGYVSKKAVKKGAHVYVNDIDAKNLKGFEDALSIQEREKTTLIPGKFPNKFGIQDSSLDAVLAQRVMHYLNPDEFDKGLKIINNLLKVGGKFYMTIDSPYTRPWQGFISEFEMRKKGFDRYPGFIKGISKYNASNVYGNVDALNFMDADVARERLEEVGFQVLEAIYLNDITKYYDELRLDGREAVGIIAVKINNVMDSK